MCGRERENVEQKIEKGKKIFLESRGRRPRKKREEETENKLN